MNLYAAQTEEAVRVTVRALDSQGNPVPGAVVEAGLDQGALQGVNVFSGCGITPQSSRPVGVTGANGEACFTLVATSVFADLLRELLYNQDNPVKLVVSSNGQLAEAKFFFYNVSHLIYQSGNDNRRAATRSGSDLGNIVNNYSFDRPRLNDHTFNSLLRRKQPDGGPFTPSFQDIGYMVYTIDDTSKVSWVQSNSNLGVNSCEQISADGKTCVDQNGSGVTLRPKSPQEGITPEDLPFSVNVTATWVATAVYGDRVYSFALKSYRFTKTWGGTGVEIVKSGPRVIGWTGTGYSPNDVTLPKTGASVAAVYEYTITVRNTGNVPAQNVVITDKLPAELGFAGASGGGTYDPILHQVTWHWTTTPVLQSIPVGGSVSVTVRLYARHKPGYAWNDNTGQNGRPDGNSDSLSNGQYNPNDPTGGYGNRPPIYGPNTPYPDPYRVVNIVEVVSEAPDGPGNFARKDASLDIWVVRPFLSLSKVALQPVYGVGDTARFVVTAQNVDRANLDSDYAKLKTSFPADYQAALTAYRVQVRDLFGRYLDFVNSSPAGQLDANVKTITFNVGDLALGATWQAILDFRVSGGLNQGEGDPNWLTNCARLYAWNLNQYQYGWGPVKNGQREPVTGRDPRPNPPYTLETGNPDSVGNYLQACDFIQDADLAITNLGEFSLNGQLPQTIDVNGNGGVDPFTQVDTINNPVRVGDTFYYIYTLTNQGSVPLNNVDFRVYRKSGTSVELNAAGADGFAVYRGTGANTYGRDTNFTLTTTSPTEVRIQSTTGFTPLAPGESLVIVVRANAIAQGISTFEAFAETTDPLSLVIRFVQDTTNVQNQNP
ncbi:MAG: hypothetical protein P3W93_010895 [Thermus sp.]|nr:hypothetical protein [Thermus sp.]